MTSLLELGVEELVSCPGGRSAAILNEVLLSGKIKVETLYDERSAGFYALGKSIKTKKPVAVLTTSGSAAVALYPALLEAKYQEGAKLVAITADRPQAFSGSGAPQTIVQKDLFEKNEIETLQFDMNSNLKKRDFPFHINVPLADPNPIKGNESKFYYESLVIVSALKESERLEIKTILKEYSGALVLESLSNLSAVDFPKAQIIKYPESFILKVGLNSFKKVFRLGGVPVLKSWREAHLHKEVYFWNKYKFQGTLKASGLSLNSISENLLKVTRDESLKVELEAYNKKVEELIEKYPSSEIAAFFKIASVIPKGSQVFIGNSMPIREWAFVDWSKFENFGQRGVNGIDGSVALALGGLSKEKDNWLILGDLTSLYNLGDFQVLKHLKEYSVKILVVNNSGGRIFERIFKANADHFINKRELSFKALAFFWGLGYMEFTAEGAIPKQVLLELKLDPKESRGFWSDLGKINL